MPDGFGSRIYCYLTLVNIAFQVYIYALIINLKQNTIHLKISPRGFYVQKSKYLLHKQRNTELSGVRRCPELDECTLYLVECIYVMYHIFCVVFPRILKHATVYETTNFRRWVKWLLIYRHAQNYSGLEHAPLSKT